MKKFRLVISYTLYSMFILSLVACSDGKATTTPRPTATVSAEAVAPAPSTLSPAVQATLIAAAQATEIAAAPLQLPSGAIELNGTPTPTATAAPAPTNPFPFTNWTQLTDPTNAPTQAHLIGQLNSQVAAPNAANATKKAPLTALAISPDKTVVALADREQIWLCEAATGRIIQVIYATTNPNYSGRPGESEERGAASLAWSSDSKKLAAGSWHGEVILWRWEAAAQRVRPGRNRLQPYSGAAYFGDAVEIAFAPGSDLLAGFASSGSITVWDSETLRVTSSFYSPYAGYMSWSPDGKKLADEYLNLHYLETGQTLYPDEKAIVSDEQPQGIAWSPDGKKLAVSADGFELGLIETPGPSEPRWLEKELTKFVPPRTTPGPAYDHYREGRRVMWSPDGQWVAVANMPAAGKISVWDNTGRKLLTITSGSDILTGLAWPTDAVIIAAGNDGSARFWQLS